MISKQLRFRYDIGGNTSSSGSFQSEAVSLVVALSFEAVRIRVKKDKFRVSRGLSPVVFLSSIFCNAKNQNILVITNFRFTTYL
jgi:hypothetical protein